MSPLLTVAQAAELLAVSRPTVYRLIREEGLPAVRPSGDLRFREEDIEQWVESRRVDRAFELIKGVNRLHPDES